MPHITQRVKDVGKSLVDRMNELKTKQEMECLTPQ